MRNMQVGDAAKILIFKLECKRNGCGTLAEEKVAQLDQNDQVL